MIPLKSGDMDQKGGDPLQKSTKTWCKVKLSTPDGEMQVQVLCIATRADGIGL